MKHIKIYEIFDENEQIKRKEVDDLCKKYLPISYKINDDLSVNVYDDVYLNEYQFDKIPIKFNRIDGHFTCNNNRLTDLENSPRYVKEGFSCSNNRLQTLIGGPDFVGKSYQFSRNYIWDTYGFPETFSGNISSGGNYIDEILSLSYRNSSRFIHLLNDYKVIRKSNIPNVQRRIIIQDRLEEALAGVGIDEFNKYDFQHYKLV